MSCILLQATQQGLQQVAAFDTKDGLYDCAWSEVSTAGFTFGLKAKM